MKQRSIEMTVGATPAATFQAFSDFDHAAEHIPAILSLEKVTDGPWGVGSRFRETRRIMKRECTEEMEIIEWAPGQAYAVRCDSCGARYESRFEFQAQGSDTLVRLTVGVQPLSFMAKCMSPLSGLMFGSMMKLMRADLDAMKARAEGAQAPA